MGEEKREPHLCIVTHSRPNAQLTLKMLRTVYAGQVDIWLSDPAQRDAYAALNCDDALTFPVSENFRSYHEKLNAIALHYPVGARVVVLEDDIQGVFKKADENKLTECRNDFMQVCRDAFLLCEKRRLTLWGVSPHANPFYMKAGASTDLKFIASYLYGFISTHDKWTLVSSDFKQDYERTLRHYTRDGGVVRINDVCVKTPPAMSNAGGFQSDYEANERLRREAEATARLVEKFAPLAQVNSSKKTGVGALRLRDPMARKYGRFDWKKVLLEREKNAWA